MIAGGCGRGWGPHHAYKTGKKKAKIDKMSSFMIQKYAANRVFEGLDGSSKSLFAAERAMRLARVETNAVAYARAHSST